ncbi:hypothetical protein JRI60_10965 [Archangium violaceum]|uniref:hypothetical protein n=1 Tax=Archangium violaceum TaxID=83451 RepID=UPI00194FA212|nr:hypothetical protein [Archangium violaceum]QRN99498.1 hypothetical protein JRI60_10965 [Archangium violaceum]
MFQRAWMHGRRKRRTLGIVALGALLVVGGATMGDASATTPTTTAQPTTTTTASSSGNTFPDRWSVGAPGVGTYSQTDAHLPVPAGYTEISPPNGEYDLYTCGSVVLDHVYIRGFIYLGTNCSGTVTIKNSIIAPPAGTNQRSILNNSNGGLTLNIIDTTIRPEPVPLGGTNAALTDHATNGCAPNCYINMNRVDVANSGGMCLCGENTTIENSWLHDNYIAHLADPSEAHTGGVFPYGGSGPVTIRNNRLEPGFNAGTGQPVNNYWQAITAVLFTQGADGTVLRNYVAEGNFISLGAFDVGVENGEGLVFRNNVFGPNHWGETTTCSTSCGVTYADWSGNVKGDINGVKTSVVVPHP